jgi:cell division protein ZapE
VVVATSNVAPDDLYKGGLNRALFLPFIAQISAHMDVLRLDARTDFRLEKLAGVKMWLVPADRDAAAALDKAWIKLTGSAPCKPRDIAIKCRVRRMAWRDFRSRISAKSRWPHRITCGSRMTITLF